MWRIGVAVVATAACGRFDFQHSSAPDASADAGADAAIADGEPLPADLIAWYRFDDPAPAAFDSTANQLHGSCMITTTCPSLVQGVHGSAARFDGVDDAIVVPASALFDLSEATLAMWVRVDAFPPAATPFGHLFSRAFGAGAANSWEIFVRDTPQVVGGGDSTATAAYIGGPVALGVWTHVAVSWSTSTLAFWLDGVLQTEQPFAVAFDTSRIVIGADDNNGGLEMYLTGALDDLRVYRRVLTPAEIALLAMP